MELDRKSWHSKYYSAFYTWSYRLPDSLCPYFWKLVFAILMFPLLFPSLLFNKLFKSDMPSIFGGLLNILAFGIGQSFIKNKHVVFNLGLYLKGWLVLFLFIGVMILICYLAIKIKDYRDKNQYNNIPKEKKPNIIVEMLKAFIGKYCPKIDWK